MDRLTDLDHRRGDATWDMSRWASSSSVIRSTRFSQLRTVEETPTVAIIATTCRTLTSCTNHASFGDRISAASFELTGIRTREFARSCTTQPSRTPWRSTRSLLLAIESVPIPRNTPVGPKVSAPGSAQFELSAAAISKSICKRHPWEVFHPLLSGVSMVSEGGLEPPRPFGH